MGDTLGFQCLQWLIEAGQKLGREEFQLLKVLYLKTLPLSVLQDEVKEPVDDAHFLYDLPHERDTPSDVAATFHGEGSDVRENTKLSPSQSLALFVHRLQILVPTSDRLEAEDTRNMGAKVCLSSLERVCGSLPTVVEIEISQESKLIECLVKSYVNMTTDQRSELKRHMAGLVGLNIETSTIFDIFSKLFVKRCDLKEIITKFTSSMEVARCYRLSYIELKQDLETQKTPHHEIVIPCESGTICIYIYIATLIHTINTSK